MITAIPNQSVNFAPSLLKGCACDTLDPALIIDPTDDNLMFQIGISRCADAVGLVDGDFEASNWKGSGGFFVTPGSACAGNGNNGSTLVESSFTPTVGQVYTLVFFIPQGSVGSVGVVFGGFSQTISAPGDYSFSFIATSTQRLEFTIIGDDTSLCIQAAQIYGANTDIEVSLLDVNGTPFFTIDPLNDPEYFTYGSTSLTVNIPMFDADHEGCFTVQVDDTCDTVTLVSNTIKAMDTSCTLKIRVCNDGDSMGFTQDFAPEARLDAQLVRPEWEYDISEERYSNGRISRPYADRQRAMEFRISLVSEDLHQFLSSIPLWNHFYIGQDEYVMDADGYRPIYGDVFDGTGGIVRTVRPKQELLRNVLCGPETLAGCVPPPNLWVQGTGPNNDYILTQDGDRVLLNS